MANSKRKCGHCKSYFRPERGFPGPVAWCSDACGTALAFKRLPAQRKKQEADERREHRKAKERIKTRSEWLREAQAAFNGYIRERDKSLPCVSCGGRSHDRGLITGSRWDAGHYRSIGANPELRFNEDNCHRQCVRCNRELSGNAVNYRLALIKRIGQQRLGNLEGPHQAKRYTIDDLKEIKSHYKKKLKALQMEQAV